MTIRIATVAEPSRTIVKVDGRLQRDDFDELERMIQGLEGPVALDLAELGKYLDAAHGADVVVGSLSLLMSGSMLGEVTPVIVQAVLESPGKKILLPINKRKVEVVGAEGRTLDALSDHAVQRIAFLIRSAA